MEFFLQIAAVVFLGAGLILRFQSKKYRTEFGQSIRWYQVKYWFMPWIAVDYFTKKGHRMFSTSTALIMLGVVSIFVLRLGIVTSP